MTGGADRFIKLHQKNCGAWDQCIGLAIVTQIREREHLCLKHGLSTML